ncbi:MAG: general secretion pathway protein B [Planctomycetaceae bacterium]|jgi:general secretion pathway protein B
MSYILEALNKSEQERRGSQTPDLNTVHRPPPAKTATSKPWLGLVLVIILLNALAVIYWLSRKPSPEPSADNSVATQPANTNTAQAKPALPPANVQVAPPVQSLAPDSEVISPTSIPLRAPATPVRITELPINVQRQIPNLVFSSHLYSDDSGFRMVNINGKMIREGDMLANDLKLVEITEGGVVLNYRHYLFEVSVLRDWSFN